MKRDVALVLSSGGARGCAHIGAIKVLERNNFNITSVAGTSAGALVGGIFATGELAVLEEWISSLDLREILRLTDLSLSNRGFVKGRKVIEKLRGIIPDRNIEDLAIPFCAVATEILTGVETAFTEGNLFDAIRASISIPTVFQPFKIGARHFVDGGIMNPVPIEKIKRHKGDLLVVVDVNASIPYEKPPPVQVPAAANHHGEQIKKITNKLDNLIPAKATEDIGIFNLSNKSISLMMRRISDLILEKNPPDLLIPISQHAFNFYDFYKAKEIIREGERAATQALEKWNKG